jgi:hypothetical protein
MEFKGNLPSAEPSQSDWNWVKKQIEDDAPVSYDASDPDEGPYDPNDDEAVERFLTDANRVPALETDRTKKIAKSA